MNYTVIIPIYNEINTLKRLLKKLSYFTTNLEIIIVDDGSYDGTNKLLKNQTRFKIIENKKNRGKGYSIRKGINSASFENIILIDGDLEIDIEQIPFLIKRYEVLKQSVLVGIRWPNIKKKELSTINDLGNYLFNFIFNIIYDTNFNDILCCVKIIKKNIIASLELEKDDFSIESEIMAKLAVKKIPVKEININYLRRSAKQGKKLKMIHGLSILSTILKTKLFYKEK